MTIKEILELFKKHIKLFIILPIVFGIATAAFCWGVLTNDYTSAIDIYVLAKNEQATNFNITNMDMTTSQQITNDVAVLVKSNRVRIAVRDDLNIESLNAYTIDVASTEKNRVITLKVTGKSPQGCARVAESLAKQTSKLAVEIMNVEAVNIIDNAEPPTYPSGPPRTLYVCIAIVVGLVLAMVITFLIDVMDTTIKSKEEMMEKFNIPVLSQMPYQKDLKR